MKNPIDIKEATIAIESTSDRGAGFDMRYSLAHYRGNAVFHLRNLNIRSTSLRSDTQTDNRYQSMATVLGVRAGSKPRSL